MVADRHITDDELDEIRSISDDSGWERRRSRSTSTSARRWPRSAPPLPTRHVDALLDDIDARITSTVLRRSLFSAARDVAGVDHDIAPEEESLLGQVAARFA